MNSLIVSPAKDQITGTVSIPGSKSYTNRALIMASLTHGPVELVNPLFSDDTEAMIDCLQTLGLVVKTTPTKIMVNDDISSVTDGEYQLNARDSGTTIRFMLALCCVIPGVQVLQGNKRLQERPIRELVDALRQLGADIEYLKEEGHAPLRISSSHLNEGRITIPGDVSSQYITALLMISPYIGNVQIVVEGEQVSKPYIEMTIDGMRQWGVQVKNRDFTEYLISAGQQYQREHYTIEGDFSTAGYFFAIAALTESTITLQNLNPRSKQADMQLMESLEKLGSTIDRGDNSITIKGKMIPNIDIDMEDFPDQVQTMAVLCAFVPGTSVIRGVRSLRIKETERVIAVQAELKKMGISTKATHDVLTIYGGLPEAAAINTYNDHRMAMSFAIAGTKVAGMQINDPHVVAKTVPHYWQMLKEIGITISYNKV